MKNWMIIALCVSLAVSVTACSQRGNSEVPEISQSQSASGNSSITSEQEADSGLPASSGNKDISEQNNGEETTSSLEPDAQILLHVKGEEEGSGAVVYDTTSIQEIICYLNNLQATNNQEETPESYCVEFHVTVGNTYDVYELTTDNGDENADGKVLIRKIASPESEERNEWFLVDADIWNTIDQFLYLPFTYENGKFVNRPAHSLR